MKKRLISLITSITLILSSAAGVIASDYLTEPFTDDFSDKLTSEKTWKFGNSADASSPNTLANSANAVVITDDGTMKITSNSSSNKYAIYPFTEYVTDNVKVKYKLRMPNNQIATISFTGNKNSGQNKAATLNTIFLRTDNSNMYVAFDHAYGVAAQGGQHVTTIKNFDSEQWYSFEFTVYGEERQIGISVEGGNEVKKAFMTSNSWNIKPSDSYDGLSRIAFGAYKAAENVVEVDDVSIVKDIPLQINEISVNDGAVNVDTEEPFVITFNKDIEDASGIMLLDSELRTVVAEVNPDGKTVTVTPENSLESLAQYMLVIPVGITAKDGKVLEIEKTVSFTTKLVDSVSIKDAEFTDGNFTAKLINSSDTITANAVLTVYEVNDGVKRLVKKLTENVTIDEETEYSKVVSDLPENYEVTLSILGETTNPLCASASFDNNGAKMNVSEVVTEKVSSVDYENGTVTIAGNIGTLSYVHKVIEVTGTDGDVIYADQILTNENGSYKFTFIPVKGVVTDKYTVTVNGTEMTEVLVEELEIDYSQFKCSITKPVIEGILSGGEEITANYDFTSVIGEDEGDTVYEWYIADTEGGEYAPISGADKKSYMLTSDDEYKYIQVKVKPQTKLGKAEGEMQESEPVKVLAKPVADNVSISGTAKPGSKLTGKYTYSHKGEAEENGTEYKWLTSSSKNGTYKEVGNGLTYVLKSSDAGKYIKFTVTPACDVEPKIGITEESEPVLVKSSGGTTGGGGGNSGTGSTGYIGSMVNKTPAPTLEPVIEVEEEKVPFGDIKEHWAKDYINTLYNEKIVEGNEKGEFNPDGKITRAEFTAMIVRLLGLEEGKYINMFEDVVTKDWYSGYIQTAVSNGIVRGDGTNFRPSDEITREEMAVVCVRVYEQKLGKSEEADASISDADKISSWAVEAVEKAYSTGLITGKEDGAFEPKTGTTRAEAAAVMVRLINNIKEVQTN